MAELFFKKFNNELKIAITNHYRALNERFKEETFYGYALYTSEDVFSIGPVANRNNNITVEIDNDMYNYYRYSPDEWSDWDDFEMFDVVNKIIGELYSKPNAIFKQIKKEILSESLKAMDELDENGIFGIKNDNRFLIIWISDSDSEIMSASAKKLNTIKVYQEYVSEFE
ncbi:DUF4303 domain-containing protein [Clostridium estertheticum]|uniref:DUF4303 domain-containing protein n=1 Tax=Clostridium estertheticum TaxID=238834 RepID=UPI001CF12AA5|nr:DUF4303 domain-containing protein [Clostridium estertheticum]MCB2355746.1 DUF4303 domain-containing protein [Clostridium estertheticum]WAG39335.1 DUF4303 domain-containing protein [Clostridium estertheticum]